MLILRRRIPNAWKTHLLVAISFVFLSCTGWSVEPPSGKLNKNANDRQAWAALHGAAQAEINGDLIARDRMLEEAIAYSQSFAPALSQKGKVLLGKEWTDVDSAIHEWVSNPKLQEYERRRSQASYSLESQWELAAWCAKNKMPDQQRAHCCAVIRLSPDHREARAALGHVLSDDGWITPEQMQSTRRQTESQRDSTQRYGSEMQTIARLLQNSKPAKQAMGKQRLSAIRDTRAILAAENVVSPLDANGASVVIDWLAEIPGPEASMSLARHAVFHFDPRVRALAANRLSHRDPLDYARPMLELMSYPVQSELRPVVESGNLLGYQQAFFREGMEANELAIVNTETEPSPLAGSAVMSSNRLEGSNNQLFTEQNLQGQTPATITGRQTQIALQNRNVDLINDRVMSALQIATGEKLPKEPRVWWNWLDSLAYVTRDGKPTRQYSRTERSPGSMAIVVSECFVEGTAVWTNRGPTKIERIQIGDLVLSADVESGILSFRPVIQTNRRPASIIMAIKTTTDTLRCTRGHFFWVAGKGWTASADLREGDVLHGAESPAIVEHIVQESERETYNLEVDVTGSYFVGSGKILSHDMTPRMASPMLIPGIPRVNELAETK